MSARSLVAMLIAAGVGFANSIAACSYLDQHPPQVCITADAAPDGGFRSVTLPAGWDAGSGGK